MSLANGGSRSRPDLARELVYSGRLWPLVGTVGQGSFAVFCAFAIWKAGSQIDFTHVGGAIALVFVVVLAFVAGLGFIAGAVGAIVHFVSARPLFGFDANGVECSEGRFWWRDV